MNSLIPHAYADVTKCFSTVQIFGSVDSTVDVVICTTSGQLLEFYGGCVISHCDIDCPDASCITLFYTYDPLCLHYLIQSPKEMIVVKKEGRLKVIKKYADVIDVKIKDYHGLGRPQVGIWQRGGDGKPIVTDFSTLSDVTNKSETMQSELSIALNAKLQEMTLRTNKLSKLLQEKQQCRNKVLYQFAEYMEPKTVFADERNDSDNDAVIVGGKQNQSGGSRVALSPPPLQTGQSWQRLHNGKWVVGVPVHNAHTRSVGGLLIVLDTKASYRCETVLLPESQSAGLQWIDPDLPACHPLQSKHTEATLPPSMSAVVIGVMDEPCFHETSVITVPAIIMYSYVEPYDQAVQQAILSPFKISVADSVSGQLLTFSNDNNHEADILSIKVASEMTEVEVRVVHGTAAPLEKVLAERLSFQAVPSVQCLVHRAGSSSGLAGAMVYVGQQTIIIYTSGVRQLCLLVQSLYDALPFGSLIVPRQEAVPRLADGITWLDAQLRLATAALNTTLPPGPLSEDSRITLTGQAAAQLSAAILPLQRDADRVFHSYTDGQCS